jgi:hypothetical protein
VLMRAFQNTVVLLKSNVRVEGLEPASSAR